MKPSDPEIPTDFFLYTETRFLFVKDAAKEGGFF